MNLRNLLALALVPATSLLISCQSEQSEKNNFAMADSGRFVGVRVNGDQVQVAVMPEILSQVQLTEKQTMKALANADWQDVDSAKGINHSDEVSQPQNNSFYFIKNPQQNIKQLQGPQNSASSQWWYGGYAYYRPYGGYYNYSPMYGYTNWYWPGYSNWATPYYYSYWPTYYYNYNWWYYQPVSYYNYGYYNYYWYARWW